mmetsp:Transcript_976/g.3041  ORF Transcript_976/g.3041 Transcript_976/m.3041 type:complete len:221 (-) Transcript_976:60-722(-)
MAPDVRDARESGRTLSAQGRCRAPWPKHFTFSASHNVTHVQHVNTIHSRSSQRRLHPRPMQPPRDECGQHELTNRSRCHAGGVENNVGRSPCAAVKDWRDQPRVALIALARTARHQRRLVDQPACARVPAVDNLARLHVNAREALRRNRRGVLDAAIVAPSHRSIHVAACSRLPVRVHLWVVELGAVGEYPVAHGPAFGLEREMHEVGDRHALEAAGAQF